MRHTLSARDGATASPVPTAERPANPIATPLAPVFFVAGRVATKLASRPARSWNARTRRSRFGSGGAYLVASHTPGMSAVQFQRQLGLSRYETAFQILHKLRAGMVRPNQDRIGGKPEEHVEADETYVGGRTRGKGRGVHDMVLVAGAVEVCQRKQQGSRNKRRTERYAGRVRLAVAPDRSAKSLGGFIERTVAPGATIITDDWSGYAKLGERDYCHTAIAERGDMQVAETFLPIIHLVFSNLKTWLRGIHHGVSPQHLQAYLNEFTFRFNRRFYPFNAFRSLLGIAGDVTAPTYAELYAAKSRPTTSSEYL